MNLFLYLDEYSLAKTVLDKHGINIDGHVARPVDERVSHKSDLIIALGGQSIT